MCCSFESIQGFAFHLLHAEVGYKLTLENPLHSFASSVETLVAREMGGGKAEV